jgi:hypothetical protein
MPQMREAAQALVTSRFNVWDFDAAVQSMGEAGSVKTQLTFSTNS